MRWLALCLSIMAFAGNSLLCRLALVETNIGPERFTVLRLLAGTAALAILVTLRDHRKNKWLLAEGTWPAALALALYASTFSLAYRTVPAASGALLLFGTVQTTMMGYGALHGEQLSRRQQLGVMIAVGGLLWLLLPSAASPPLVDALLMLVAGLAWAGYSLIGRSARDPLRTTSGNFLRSIPLLLVVLPGLQVLQHGTPDPTAIAAPTANGVLLAITAGALTSGCGYALWYWCLPDLSATQAATVQLLVPVLAAAGAVAWLGEALEPPLLICGLAILGGVTMAQTSPKSARP